MEYRLSKDDSDLEKILVLQKANLKQNLDQATRETQGFVSLQHDLPLLQKIQAQMPSVIAIDQAILAGYALSLPVNCIGLFPDLNEIYALLPSLSFKGRLMENRRYYYMGQICIDAAYRGQGVFKQLYQTHAQLFGKEYDCMVTEVSSLNLRSTTAHLKLGFEIIHRYEDASGEWLVIAWDWT